MYLWNYKGQDTLSVFIHKVAIIVPREIKTVIAWFYDESIVCMYSFSRIRLLHL